MPLKSFFKLYSIPTLIVIIGICLYFVVFIEIKDRSILPLHAQNIKRQPTQPPIVLEDAALSPQVPKYPAQDPITTEPQIVLTPRDDLQAPEDPQISKNLAVETPSHSSTGEDTTLADTTPELPSDPQTPPHAPQDLPTTQPRYAYVNVRSANIRALPSTDGEILQRANNGQRLVLIQTLPQSEWSEVELAHGVRGYIASYLLSDQAPQYDIYQVIVKSANIRALPSSEAPIIASVGLNHNVRVLQNEGEWSKILLESGQEGYIASRLLGK